MGKKLILILIACFFLFSYAREKPVVKERINWLSIEEVNAKIKTEPRPVLIDLFTNWCYWCKVMDKKTYNRSEVIAYINEHFYAVKLNAETRETIEWNNKSYNYNPQNKMNDFTLYVTNGQVGFPTTVIFPAVQKEPAAIPGFMEAKEMEPILKYFAEGKYKAQNFEEFSKTFKQTW